MHSCILFISFQHPKFTIHTREESLSRENYMYLFRKIDNFYRRHVDYVLKKIVTTFNVEKEFFLETNFYDINVESRHDMS